MEENLSMETGTLYASALHAIDGVSFIFFSFPSYFNDQHTVIDLSGPICVRMLRIKRPYRLGGRSFRGTVANQGVELCSKEVEYLKNQIKNNALLSGKCKPRS